jgi:hypothetical protein
MPLPPPPPPPLLLSSFFKGLEAAIFLLPIMS